MRFMHSLQARLALSIGLGITLLWLAAAFYTTNRLTHEMEEVFDTGLQASARRLLPLAVRDVKRHDKSDNEDDGEEDDDGDDGLGRRGAAVVNESVAYLVRDMNGKTLIISRQTDPMIFPGNVIDGFTHTKNHRIFTIKDDKNGISVAVAETLDERRNMADKVMLNLVLPLLAVIPLSLIAIFLAVRRLFRPVRKFRAVLESRSAQDLSDLPDMNLPTELEPVTSGINNLFSRLRKAFEAERSFAANAAHELRTPVAGAIAQAQRLITETKDVKAAQRASDIETTLKRLTRTSEKLLQFARAEGGQALLETPSNIAPVLRVIVRDFEHAGSTPMLLDIPDDPVLSLIEPDLFGILARNLIENALRHGKADTPVSITLDQNRRFVVSNEGPSLPPEKIDKLMQRFEKGEANGNGTGLGLAIVRTIVERSGAGLTIISPQGGKVQGLEVAIQLP